MTTRTAIVAAVLFAVGAGLGRYTQPPTLPPPDLRGPVWLCSLDGPHRVNRHLAPFRALVDGRPEDIPGASNEGEHWRIDLADGRVVLFLATGGPHGPGP